MLPSAGRLFDAAVAWRTGRRFPEYLRELQAVEGGGPEALRGLQARKLHRLLTHARETVPYWSRILPGPIPEPDRLLPSEFLSGLPPMDKDLFDREGRALASTAASGRRPVERSTGGSTGHNIWFLVDRETQDRRRAAARLTDAWEGVFPGTRYVTLWGASLDTRPSLGARLYDGMTNRRTLSAYGLGPGQIERYGRFLESFRPEAILSYPSILLHLAERIGQERCRRLGVRVLFTSAEALYPATREVLEALFGCPVRNRYASREFGMIAAECPAGGCLHTMDTRFLLEYLPVPGGGPPEIVLTDLDNLSQPFVRYRTGDSAVPRAGACSCGRPFGVLESVDGRVLDVIVTADGRAFGGTFFTLVLRPFNRAVSRFQVVQEEDGSIAVRVVPGPGWSAGEAEAVLGRLGRELGPTPCRVEVVDDIPVLPSGKRRVVVGRSR